MNTIPKSKTKSPAHNALRKKIEQQLYWKSFSTNHNIEWELYYGCGRS